MSTTKPVDRVRTAAHKSSLAISQADLLAALDAKLGSKLVAHLVDRSPSTVSRWRTGKTTLDETALVPLRVSYQIFKLLENEEADPTIRAWFMGSNPQLDDLSPVEAIRDGLNREALAAARAFLAGG